MSDNPRPRSGPLQRVLDFRIVRWYFKLLYVAGVWVAGYPVVGLLTLLAAPPIYASLGNAVVTLGGILLGARLFRGKGEPIPPPRPWWKMTARRTLSRVIGIIALLSVLSSVLVLIGAAIGAEPSVRTFNRITLPGFVVYAISDTLIAFLYLNSAARLPKPTRLEPEPKFKPRVKLR